MVNSKRREKLRRLLEEDERAYRIKRSKQWSAQIPTRFQRFDAEGLIGDQCGGHISRGDARQLRGFLRKPSQFLVLTGTAGLGKSTMAVSLATHLIESGKANRGIYTSTPNLLNKFSFGMKDGDPVGEHSKVDVLVMDDVGAAKESVTEHQKMALWAMIDARWSNSNLVTIMTTNMAVASDSGMGLIDWFGPTSWDRIRDDMIHVHFKGESFRGADVDI